VERLGEFDMAATFALTATRPHFTIILKVREEDGVPLLYSH